MKAASASKKKGALKKTRNSRTIWNYSDGTYYVPSLDFVIDGSCTETLVGEVVT